MPMRVAPLSSMFTTNKLEAMFGGGLPATRGEWVEQHFYSQALGREDAYMVWLPPGYDTSKQRYPSLYLLHCVGGPEGYAEFHPCLRLVPFPAPT